MKLAAYALDDADARAVWAKFSNQVGAQAMKDCYGWPTPHAIRRPGETVWCYHDDDIPSHGFAAGTPRLEIILTQPVGWGSLIKDPTTPLYWHASGVFPAFQRQGYRQAIRQHLCGEAFARGAEVVSLVVLDTNPEHLCRCHREEEAGSPWKFSGRIHRPLPGQTIFTLLRDDWKPSVVVDGYVLGDNPDITGFPVMDTPSLLAREKVCCCFHLNMPDSEPACGQG